MIAVLIVVCIIINKRGWNIRVVDQSESGDSDDSRPEKSPVRSINAVLEAEQQQSGISSTTNTWKSKYADDKNLLSEQPSTSASSGSFLDYELK